VNARKTLKRERPEDGGIVWFPNLYAFQCEGCRGWEEIHKPQDRQPDRLAEIAELLEADHMECWNFDDPRMAADARKYRKKGTLKKNLERASVRSQAIEVASRVLRSGL
jgi:hypothetical protein